MNQSAKSYVKAFFQELLLYSGQFALFYLLMQLIIEGGSFVRNFNHVGLLFALILQTSILTKYGKSAVSRAAISFLVPVIYSAMETLEGSTDLLNAAHVGFWAYALCSCVLMLLKTKLKKNVVYELLLIFVNVTIFVFLYFYFDTWKELQNKDDLVITKIFLYAPTFLKDPTHWFIIFGGAFLATTIALSRIEVEQLKLRLYSLFGQYVDENIRDMILDRGQISSEKKRLCIVFSDIRNFTVLCEKNDPESITRMLNSFFDEWNLLVKKYGGTVDKYIGDAIMVFFGLRDGAGACESAVRCAMEINERWASLKVSLASEGLPVPDGFGIGVHYGDVIIGDIGSSDRKNFTIIGDAVNVASRLESETRKLDGTLLISSSVFVELSEPIKERFHEIGDIDLKGKEKKVRSYLCDESPR